MIYYKANVDYKVTMWTKSEASAKDYGLTDTCADDGIEQASNGEWYLKGHVPPKSKQEQIQELKEQLNTLDEKSTRSIRAVLAGTATDEDKEYLANLEEQAEDLRKQLKELGA